MRRGLALLAGGAAGVLAAGPALGGLARRTLPRTTGEVRLDCLEASVEVLRDEHGIPHVFAGSLRDLARAQGYVHAQDRLFQMETLRRFAYGRLSEVFGNRTLDFDRAVRRLRIRWSAERDLEATDPETASILSAYCEGVNGFLADGPLPPELRLARIRPEPWRSIDVLAPGKVLTYTLSGNWEGELVRMRLAARLGHERAKQLDPSYPDDLPVIVPASLVAPAQNRAAWLRRLVGTGASNNWAVAGHRTASGAPIFANDPHLVVGIPVLWYLQHISWDVGSAVGATLPGVPGIILGRNEHVAWGMTTAMLDTQDLYVERLHPDDPLRYEVDGRWEQAEVVREEIRVRGRREPVVEEVVVTRHGPLVARPPEGERLALALRWSAYERGESARAFLDVLSSTTVEEADRALDRFSAPPHNFLLADRHGTIGYRLAGGPLPIRDGGNGLVPVPGWDSSHEWRGYIPEDELPRVRDPDRGYLVTANNRVVGEGYAHVLAGEYLSGFRARRIETVLDELEEVTVEDCRRLQLDLLSLPGLRLAAIARTFSSEQPLEQAALDLLGSWDGEFGLESAAGAVYGILVRRLFDMVYAEALPHVLEPFGDEAAGTPSPAGFYERSRPMILALLAARDDSFFADGRTWDGVFRAALAATVDELGPDPSTWRWGDHHRVRLDHALAAVPLLGPRLGRGPFPAGGDADTVSPIATVTGHRDGPWVGATYRAVYDLGDPDESHVMIATGQSGNPVSPHYDDLIPRWRAGELIRVPLRRESVEPLVTERLILQPPLAPGIETAEPALPGTVGR